MYVKGKFHGTLQHLECHLDDFLYGGGRLVLEDGFDGLGNGSRWEAEHLESFESFVVNLAVLRL